MPLSEAFQHVLTRLEISAKARLLVAVSGGLDSMSLLHLAHAAGFAVAAAHANFKLRGEASDADQALVEKTCSDLKIPVFTKTLRIEKAENNVQVRARDLRYEWFFELMDLESFDFLLTAHHQNDRIETFFINLLRGSGIKGLKSIPEKTGSIIRPLLHFEKSEIRAFARETGITWREDASNASDDYLRNTIRHGTAQSFSSLSGSANANFAKSMDFLNEADAYFEKEAKRFIQSLPVKNGVIEIDEKRWDTLFLSKPLHKYVFQNLGFEPNQLDQLEALKKSQSGRFVEGARYQLYRDRSVYLAEPIQQKPELKIEIHSGKGKVREPLPLEWEEVERISEFKKDKNFAYLNIRELKFPLILRRWKPGDRFTPLGMKGSKKLSDFLTDLKLSIPQKNNTYVVESEGEICWVVGLRIADNFRVHALETPCFFIKYTGTAL